MLRRIFNIVIIGSLSLGILFVTSFFYIGSRETFERQLAESPLGFFIGRTFFGITIGFLGCLVVLVANLILERGNGAGKERRIRRVLILAFGLSATFSMMGTLIFFFF